MVPLPSSEVSPFLVPQGDSEVRGVWKDSLFDCHRYGFFHPTLWNAICCPQILMAQILTRLKLNWLGEPGYEWQKTFRKVFGIVCVYWVLTTVLSPPPMYTTDANGMMVPTGTVVPKWQATLNSLVFWSFALYTLLVLTKLRRSIRQRFEIPSRHPAEDCCVSFWCGCCSVAQMARQTCDYHRQAAVCCSTTGLGVSTNHAEFMV